MIFYEYPFNERIRILLRLEDLFNRFEFFLYRNDPIEHHVSLIILFEIFELINRSDVKVDLLKELDRQRKLLESYYKLSYDKCNKLDLIKIEEIFEEVIKTKGKINKNIKNYEWLSNIRSRSIVSEGICKFDLPLYYAWQQLSSEKRRNTIKQWIMPVLPLQNAMKIILYLLRKYGETSEVISVRGRYQQVFSGRIYQFMKVEISSDLSVIPEISANKYMLWMNFSFYDSSFKLKSANVDIPCKLTFY